MDHHPHRRIELGRVAGYPRHHVYLDMTGNILICGGDTSHAPNLMRRLVRAFMTGESAAVFIVDPIQQLLGWSDDGTDPGAVIDAVEKIARERLQTSAARSRYDVVLIANFASYRPTADTAMLIRKVGKLASLTRHSSCGVQVVCRVPDTTVVGADRDELAYRSIVAALPLDDAYNLGILSRSYEMSEAEARQMSPVGSGVVSDPDGTRLYTDSPGVDFADVARHIDTVRPMLNNRRWKVLTETTSTTVPPFGCDIYVGDEVLVRATVTELRAEELLVELLGKVGVAHVAVRRTHVQAVESAPVDDEPGDGTWVSNQDGTRMWRRWDNAAPAQADLRHRPRWLDTANTTDDHQAWVTWPQARGAGADPGLRFGLLPDDQGPASTDVACLGVDPIDGHTPVEVQTGRNILVAGPSSGPASAVMLHLASQLTDTDIPVMVIDPDLALTDETVPLPAAPVDVVRELAEHVRRTKRDPGRVSPLAVLVDIPLGGDTDLVAELFKLVRINRNSGVQVICRVHSPNDIPPQVRMSFDTKVAAGITDPHRVGLLFGRQLPQAYEDLLKNPLVSAVSVDGRVQLFDIVSDFATTPDSVGLRDRLTAAAAVASAWWRENVPAQGADNPKE